MKEMHIHLPAVFVPDQAPGVSIEELEEIERAVRELKSQRRALLIAGLFSAGIIEIRVEDAMCDRVSVRYEQDPASEYFDWDDNPPFEVKYLPDRVIEILGHLAGTIEYGFPDGVLTLNRCEKFISLVYGDAYPLFKDEIRELSLNAVAAPASMPAQSVKLKF